MAARNGSEKWQTCDLKIFPNILEILTIIIVGSLPLVNLRSHDLVLARVFSRCHFEYREDPGDEIGSAGSGNEFGVTKDDPEHRHVV